MTNIERPTGPTPCFKCGTQLLPVDPTPRTVYYLTQPQNAVTFKAHGNYGSTVFDPDDGSSININVCDECLLRHRELVQHIKYQRQMDRLVYMKPWDPAVEYVGQEMEKE